MSQTISWDASFELKTLNPAFEDIANVASPVELTSAESQVLECPLKSLILALRILHISTPATYCSVKVEVSETTSGAIVYKTGFYLVDSLMPNFELPLQKITNVKISYVAGTDVNVHFAFLLG